MQEHWPNFNDIVDSDSIRYFNSFAPLFGSIGGFLVHILIRYVFNENKRIVICILNLFGCIIWALFLLITPERWTLGIVLRSLQGLVLGGNATITPMIILEIAPINSRGMFGGFAQIGKTTGFLIYYIIATYSGWRMMVVVGAVFCLLHSVFVWFTPENYEVNGLLKSDTTEEVIQSLYDSQFGRRRKCIECSHECRCGGGQRGAREGVFQRKFASRLAAGAAMMVFQQFCGINALNANLSGVMEHCGLRIAPNLKSAVSTTAQWLGVFVASFVLDACGRRALWILSASGVAAGLAMFAASLKVAIRGWFAALCVFLIMVFFGLGFGPIPWFVAFEMFPQEVRMMGQAVVNCAAMLATFAIAFINPIMTEELGQFYVIIIYMAITVVAVFFGIWGVKDPDTVDHSITIL